MDKNDFIRWYKKGIVLTMITYLLFGLKEWIRLQQNPITTISQVFSDLFKVQYLELIIILVIFPFIWGFVIEQIDKRIK